MHLLRTVLAMTACVAWTATAGAQAIELKNQRLVDLTHAFDERTIYWPTSPSRFELTELAHGETPGGYFYSSYSLCTPEHGGTHLDAPVHFSRDGRDTAGVPLEQLVGPAVVIDISGQSSRNPDYRLTREDVLAFEARHGPVPDEAIVLLRTGWSRFWPDRLAYMGDDTPGDASKLRFPGYGAAAARLLVEERKAAVLGIDTASIDYGGSTDFVAHRIAAARNVVNLENLTNLEALPATGAIVIALPMKIAGGSGGPVRVIAFVP